MKEKIATILVMAILFVSIIPRFDASGVTENQQINLRNTQSMPQQKISPQLLEQMRNMGISDATPNEIVKILIHHNPNTYIKMPEGVEILNRFNLVPIISAKAPLSKIEEISSLQGVAYVYLDLKMHVTGNELPELPYPDYSKDEGWKNARVLDEEIPSDPWFGEYPTYLNETTELIGARQLWTEGITGKNVTIAIIDTGINKYHPDLDDMDDDPTTHDPKVLAEASFVPYEPPDDWHGHGTHVASTAAGTGATGAMGFYGIFPYSGIHNATILPGTQRGVAPGAYLYNAKAFDSGGSGDISWIIGAIEWSVACGADIISGSFGGWPDVPADQDPIVLALKEAIKHGVVVVIAAGNSGFGYFTVESPGFAPDVITVGATTETDHLIFFSSRGPEGHDLHAKPDVVAPGTSVVAAFAFFREIELYIGNQIFYWEISGTSMATPHVSGAAALLLEAFPGATPYTVKSAIMQGADDIGLDPMAQGAGRLNVKKAYDIMDAAPKVQWQNPVPTGKAEPMPFVLRSELNLTGKSVLIEDSFSYTWMFSTYISMLQTLGASVTYGSSPYSNVTLVNPGTGEPNYDVFIIPRPAIVDETALPPSTLAHYVQHNGTVLFIGDSPDSPYMFTDYNNWTGQWGVTWNNTAVGGFTSHMGSHGITEGISELYFGSPLTSLIVNGGALAETVVWDPIFPSVAVWTMPDPATGKVVIISDDGVLNNQYLQMADNLQFGLNIIKWFTGAEEIQYPMTNIFFDDVEAGAGSWIADGLWHITQHRSSSLTHAWYYGIEGSWNFDTGGRNWGYLISPTFDLSSVFKAELKFSYWYETETTGTAYDQRWILVSLDGGPFFPVEQLSSDPMMTWLEKTIDMSIFTGHNVQVAFFFDTRDEIANNYEGWYVDDIRIDSEIFVGSPPSFHEIGISGTWPKYVLANTTAVISVNVTNFGTFSEDVELYMNGDLVETVAALATNSSTVVEISVKLNATLICDASGVNMTLINIYGSIADPEIDYTNNGFSAEIAAVPKGKREGVNPLLSVITPMKIESTSAPLITMYHRDFTLHNLTAFVGGGELVDAKFQITGSVAQIADFANVTKFTYQVYSGMLPDPSPAYFIPNMTSILGDTLDIGNVSAPAMLFAELQVYIAENTPVGVYTGRVELLNGTTVLAYATLDFEVRNAKYRVLWEDYYNDYEFLWYDCERLWGGAVWGYGVFEWWKVVAQAGFDVDSLHQQAYLNRHIGLIGTESVDPLGIIAYGGYDALFMNDVDFEFRPEEIAVFRQLYETGKMDFAVLYDGGSEALVDFTSYYGIGISGGIFDLVITEFDSTHPMFSGVENFTLYGGPVLLVENLQNIVYAFADAKSTTTGIATGAYDFSPIYAGGFVVAVNEMQATPHLTTRMVAVSDSNLLEYLEYTDFMIWYYTFSYAGEGEVVSRIDTDKFLLNMIEWLDPQFANKAPEIDYCNISPTKVKLGETVSIDVVVHDPEGDSFSVIIAVHKPDGSWDNATVPSVGGHWLRSFTAGIEDVHEIYVIATDSYDAATIMLCGTVNVVNARPEIVSSSISPATVVTGEKVFMTLNTRDTEDGVPTFIMISIIAPNGSSYGYNYTNMGFVNLIFDTSGMAEGVYSVNALIKDSNDAQTAATIGHFEVKPVPPEPFPIREATLGIGVIGLVALLLILLLVFQRLPGKPSTP